MNRLSARQTAEQAGRWKADHGQAPHYSRASLALWSCYACPLDDCDWHHDDDAARPSAPALLEAKVLEADQRDPGSRTPWRPGRGR
ncbi:hypothetical protein [Streptomyces solaniscabiei]|uniref:hypothetical protein n=1 Tax=Streptomyces solaniscabiei TaxID=2683255 RepID=UPI001CE33E2D|nr:hypothetical protein [Streptomyces solaniscabiei]